MKTTSACRDCGMPIIWLKTRNEKNIPVDPINVDEFDVFDKEKHTCHFDTCPERVQNNGQQGQAKTQDSIVLTPFLQTKLLEYVNSIKAGGVGHKTMGLQFLGLCEQAFDPANQPKPAAPPAPPAPSQDDFDDDIPF